MLNAKSIMKTAVHVAKPGETVQNVVVRLGQEKVSGLPVVDEAGCIIGVITELDLLRAYRDNRSDQLIGQLMKTDVITVSEDTMLDQIVDLFLAKGIRRVFVVHDEEMLGVISCRDLVSSSQIRKQVSAFACYLRPSMSEVSP
ncbi:MAG: CBS domain-containing protein [Pirellulaceae bacterium]|jgi:CBS domain-containing protein|nr:CBS domain-containing protein [Pirellulaceae bacterium]MDP6719412.1 CBS domain-containing protein [Pirellulaceae bacterium]